MKKVLVLTLTIFVFALIIGFFTTPVHHLQWMGYMCTEDANIHVQKAQEQGIFIITKTPATEEYLPKNYVSVFIQKDRLSEYWKNYD